MTTPLRAVVKPSPQHPGTGLLEVHLFNGPMGVTISGSSPEPTLHLDALDSTPLLLVDPEVLPTLADALEAVLAAIRPAPIDDQRSDLLYEAWAVIANAGAHQGGWPAQHPEWVAAAERWRDAWHATLPNRPNCEHCGGAWSEEGLLPSAPTHAADCPTIPQVSADTTAALQAIAETRRNVRDGIVTDPMTPEART